MYLVLKEFCGIEVGTELDDSAVSKEFEKELIDSGTLEYVEGEPTEEIVPPVEETPALVEPTEEIVPPVEETMKGAKSKK